MMHLFITVSTSKDQYCGDHGSDATARIECDLKSLNDRLSYPLDLDFLMRTLIHESVAKTLANQASEKEQDVD